MGSKFLYAKFNRPFIIINGCLLFFFALFIFVEVRTKFFSRLGQPRCVSRAAVRDFLDERNGSHKSKEISLAFLDAVEYDNASAMYCLKSNIAEDSKKFYFNVVASWAAIIGLQYLPHNYDTGILCLLGGLQFLSLFVTSIIWCRDKENMPWKFAIIAFFFVAITYLLFDTWLAWYGLDL